MDEWECTGEVRYVLRQAVGNVLGAKVHVLQQRWRRNPLLHAGYDYEWRDVPIVTEEGE